MSKSKRSKATADEASNHGAKKNGEFSEASNESSSSYG